MHQLSPHHHRIIAVEPKRRLGTLDRPFASASAFRGGMSLPIALLLR